MKGTTRRRPAAGQDRHGQNRRHDLRKMMSQAITGQRETSKLVDQLMKSFAAIETENDPTALREKLAEHGLVLTKLQTTVQAQSRRMDVMQTMMNVGMMGREDKRGEHKN